MRAHDDDRNDCGVLNNRLRRSTLPYEASATQPQLFSYLRYTGACEGQRVRSISESPLLIPSEAEELYRCRLWFERGSGFSACGSNPT
ncbi:hypothetical protein J2S34_002807 [Nitrobacter winogradskyi]|uniref:Uncharacterized protein n=1 Tax=Nitrobacter winogradskyi TaxID=913 RepID=A0ACC6AL15_NITWI|nr:hypothetical protein [Nitrobacter winogradskyi]